MHGGSQFFFKQAMIYEDSPIKCAKCGAFGHSQESCKRHVEQLNVCSKPGNSNSNPKDPVLNTSCATVATFSGSVPAVVSAPLASATVSIPVMSRHGALLDHTNSISRRVNLNSSLVFPQNTSWADMAKNEDDSDVDGEIAVDGDRVRTSEVGDSILVPYDKLDRIM
ncbi:hypothetical protein NE237_001411 [Protea cynaroides]|uniref:CCHC-type domain-containing protein n=1 Tax=Protea cynaroides TaxID=273540 RepID=A0A9Q0QYG0_9MAGN|nr:hypothetical protein NE237_001411 [Protea cynaroides]